MKDFVGQDLNEGDYVAFIRPLYRQLVLGKIIKLTPKKVRVEYKPHWSDKMDDSVVDPSDVVKLEGTDALSLLLKA